MPEPDGDAKAAGIEPLPVSSKADAPEDSSDRGDKEPQAAVQFGPILDSDSEKTLQSADVLLDSLTADALALAHSFQARIVALQQTVRDAGDCTLEHLLVYDTAVELLQHASRDMTCKGNELIGTAVRLSRELRNIDKVAERVRGIRQQLVALEAQIDKIK
ncbi:hypothetical protein WJX72_000613 [[Myrmecia] bisecta]|uniref:BLOC-1-related complex subunit 6 C-terminal helix domain-containing protein n=1 Tax=[Myrmecia] bisecta TaxID=41462 RepID=A0AAW1Q5D0_9CHLO